MVVDLPLPATPVTRIIPFSKCENLTIYTDSDMVKDYCSEYGIPVKPANEFKNESIKKPFKLRIRE